MNLTWIKGHGPSTTQALAAEVEAEGRLIQGWFVSEKGRCLWGVIENWDEERGGTRMLPSQLARLIETAVFNFAGFDALEGTPEQLCAEACRRLRAIP